MKVAVIMGGPSREHDISLQSGRMVAAGLSERHEVWPVRIEKDRSWSFPSAPLPRGTTSPDWAVNWQPSLSPQDGPARLGDLRPEVVFVALHGAFGEDGRIQGMLEWLGLPYVGSGPQASALAMDKSRSKDVYLQNNLPTPQAMEVFADEWAENEEALHTGIASAVGFPLVAKAPNQGSSIGMAMVVRPEDLSAALAELLPLEGRVLLEKKCDGQELTCGVINGPEGKLMALPPTLIQPKTSDYFDFHAKYQADACEEITPAPIDKATTQALQDMALRAHRVLGCYGMSRTDALLLEDGSLTLLETNTIPGFTPTSLLPQGAEAAGYPFADLLDLLLASALAR